MAINKSSRKEKPPVSYKSLAKAKAMPKRKPPVKAYTPGTPSLSTRPYTEDRLVPSLAPARTATAGASRTSASLVPYYTRCL